MLTTLSINNYRSILQLTMPLGSLNVITGPNGSGKSNLYRALRLLAETAQGGVVNSLAGEGGLGSTFWAGPEKISRRMRTGEIPVQGGPRRDAVRLRLGFAGEDFGYAISLGLPKPSPSAFALDPEIKRECIWAGSFYRPAGLLVDREGPMVRVRDGRTWNVAAQNLSLFTSMFDQLADPSAAPEVFRVRETIRNWRFYDHFRTDRDAPARKPQLGTRTPVLHHDGRDLAAAVQTIREIGDSEALDAAISDAFPGARLDVRLHEDGRFSLMFYQEGLLRPLTGAELSDGTLRYILWVAALLTPRPPSLMVLNEPETSLHPDLLPALARLILRASEHSQVWVVSHASRLVAALNEHPECHAVQLEKPLGQTEIIGQGILDTPAWHWADK
ncbi:ATP-binding protein [Hahella sp. KA22]|uniref:AAA family ATPase n=1 Tax=Hahella sp. KA22 TaxID=1628392 RepID=UPI000FDD705C|nr:AAA family ATPase [Hahella sp. KA22]AZZ93124.1 ATP-binding protein [Hahella sp. KA22]QAY56498.1 ATP-binding protein [Hahella sp. KA22]